MLAFPQLTAGNYPDDLQPITTAELPARKFRGSDSLAIVLDDDTAGGKVLGR